jgi:hypothetical protein
MADARLRKQVVPIAMPARGFINASKIEAIGYGVPMIADAYLYNGEPINYLTGAAQFQPNVQPTENAQVAAALARAHPLQTRFSGYQSFGNAVDRSPRVPNPTSWKINQQ